MPTRAGKLIRDLWAGDVPLKTAFWEYAILYDLLLNAAATMGSMALFSMDMTTTAFIVHFAPAPYEVLTFTAVWRAAGKYRGNPAWAGAARVAIIVTTTLTALL